MDKQVTPRIAAINSRLEGATGDLALTAVQRWKDANPGGKAIGMMPVYTPRELLHAAGVLPVGIFGGGEGVEIVRGDAYFQSYICQIPRSTIELGLNGSYDALDGMIFPSTCDVIRNLSGMWQILFPDKYVRYFDVPQNFRKDLGGAFMADDMRELLADMAKLSGKSVSDDDVWDSIEVYSENRRLMRELYALRAAAPWLVPTTELYQVLHAGNQIPVEEHNELLVEYTEAARESGRPVQDRARVAVTGFFCEQPPLGLLRTLERSGCYVVADDFARGSRFLQGPIERTEGDPVVAIADAFVTTGTPCQSMYLDAGKKGQTLLDEVKDAGAEGVIFAAPSFCDPALLDQPMVQKAVSDAGIPVTAFKYSENTGQFQVIREQTGAFADAIKIWGDE